MELLFAEGKNDEAVSAWQNLIFHEDDPLADRIALARKLTELNRFEEASVELNHVLRSDPDNFDAHFMLGVDAMRRENSSEAIEHWKSVLAVHPEHLDALYNLGLAYASAGNIDKAIGGEELLFSWTDPWRLLFLVPLLPALLYGAFHYRFSAKRIMANHKSSDGIRFASKLSAPRVTLIYSLGNFIAYMILLLGVGLIIGVAFALLGPETMVQAQLGQESPFGDLPKWMSFAIIAALYLAVFLLWNVLLNAFVTYPLMRHMAQTTSLSDVAGLIAVSQRARDEFAEAEGFAEALDLGAAI